MDDTTPMTSLKRMESANHPMAMGWFADSMRLRDVIGVVSSIEIPLPGTLDEDESGPEAPEDPLAA